MSFIPVVGKGFAVANTVLYVAEGDYAKAAVSAIYIVPGGEYVGLAIEATTGATALVLLEDMVQNHDNPAIRTLYEYYHYDEMYKGRIALNTLLSGLGAYGGYRSYNALGVYEGLSKAELGKYDVIHVIERYAYSNGYNGIIAPSARTDGEKMGSEASIGTLIQVIERRLEELD